MRWTGEVAGGIGGAESSEARERGIKEGIAGGGFALEFLPGGGSELVLTLDGEQELLFAGELKIVFEVCEGRCDPRADGALGDTQLDGDGGGAKSLAVEGERLLAQRDGVGSVGKVGDVGRNGGGGHGGWLLWKTSPPAPSPTRRGEVRRAVAMKGWRYSGWG